MAFEIPKVNMFQQPIQPIGPVGGQGAQRTGGSSGAVGGQTPYEKDMANFRSNLPAFNGTGDLQPANDSKFNLMA